MKRSMTRHERYVTILVTHLNYCTERFEARYHTRPDQHLVVHNPAAEQLARSLGVITWPARWSVGGIPVTFGQHDPLFAAGPWPVTRTVTYCTDIDGIPPAMWGYVTLTGLDP